VFGGCIASGKSTLAEKMGDSLGAPVIGSDLTRKQMAGLLPMEKGPGGLYKGL
jgi:predicted kinase